VNVTDAGNITNYGPKDDRTIREEKRLNFMAKLKKGGGHIGASWEKREEDKKLITHIFLCGTLKWRCTLNKSMGLDEVRRIVPLAERDRFRE